MPRDTAITIQGQAWDQVALERYGSEKQMDILPSANVEEADAIFFGGGIELALPDVRPQAVRSMPPWERM